MAESKEKVLYEFQGDVSSLKSATKQALSSLSQYESTIQRIAKSGDMNIGKTAFTGFQRTVNGVIKQVNTISGQLSKMSSDVSKAFTPDVSTVTSAYKNIDDALKFLKSSSTLATEDIKLLTMVLQESKSSLDPITARMTALSTSFTKVAQTSEQSMSKISSSSESAVQKTSTNVTTLGQQWDNYINRMSKSAEQSAQVFASAGKFTGFSTGVDTIAAKIVLLKSRMSDMGAQVSSIFQSLGAKFDPLVSKLQGFTDKATNAGNRVTHAFSTVSAAFRRTSTNADTAGAAHNRLGSSIDNVKEKVGKETKEIDKETEKLNKKNKALKASEEAHGSFGSAIASITSSMMSENGILNSIINSFFTLAGVDLGNMLADGAKSAIDYVENMNLFQVAMGSSIDKGTAFINKMQEIYGMDPSNLMRYAGNFYQLTDAIGMADGASASISLSLTKMANDLASLFNKDINSTVEALSSGMMGMTRTVRQFGMDIRNTTLQVTAFKYGLTEQVENMSEANRQALRFITMHEQAQNAINQFTHDVDGGSTAMGDFARNIETPANQLRIFKEQMSQLGRAVGNFVVAPLAKALPYINGFIMALRTLVNFVATLMGVSVKAGNSLSDVGDSAEDAAAGVGGIGGAADKASKKLKQLIAPFDELNVLQEQSNDSGGGGGGFGGDVLDPALAEAISSMELNLENIKMKANEVRDSILGFLGLTITTDPITGEQIIQWDKEAFQTNVMDSLNNFKTWFTELDPIWQGVAAVAGFYGVFQLLPNPIAAVLTALTLLTAYSEPFRTAMQNLGNTLLTSLVPIGESLSSLFSTVGTDIVTMWSTHIAPTIQHIGDALAPALDTLGSLWGNVSVIIADAFKLVENLWTVVLKPIIEGAMKIIQDLADMFKTLWADYVGPVFEYIGDGLEDLWLNTLSPVIDRVIEILGKVWELIMALWNTVLAPLVNWIIYTLGPTIREVFKDIWDIIKQTIEDVMGIIDGLLQVLEGLIDFLVGVFTGDWERAWKGLVNIFVGIGNTLISIFETVVNAIISLINGLIGLVFQGVQTLINGLLGAVEGIADLLGLDLNLQLNFATPKIPYLNIPRIPQMATGGVVTGPTHLIAGEGKYSEAILPLDDSPQMQDLIDKIVDAIDKDKPDDNGGPTEVHVFIGGKEYDAFTYKSSQRGKTVVGKQPVKIGG